MISYVFSANKRARFFFLSDNRQIISSKTKNSRAMIYSHSPTKTSYHSSFVRPQTMKYSWGKSQKGNNKELFGHSLSKLFDCFVITITGELQSLLDQSTLGLIAQHRGFLRSDQYVCKVEASACEL